MSNPIRLCLDRNVGQRSDSVGNDIFNVSNLSDLLHLLGAEVGDAAVHAESLSIPRRRLRAGTALFHQGNVAEAIYFVGAGTFKIFRTAEDGYEQVLGFLGRAEVLGFDAVCLGRHPNAAVALEDSSVFVLQQPDIFTLAQRLPIFDRALHLAVSRQLTRRGEIAEVMAAVAAEVRLARFLVQLSQQMAACGQSPRRLLLRMSRRDIASHLGVAHETVSRSFSALSEWGYLRVNNRELEIIELEGLKCYSRSTRGLVDAPNSPARAQVTALKIPTARAVPRMARV